MAIRCVTCVSLVNCVVLSRTLWYCEFLRTRLLVAGGVSDARHSRYIESCPHATVLSSSSHRLVFILRPWWFSRWHKRLARSVLGKRTYPPASKCLGPRVLTLGRLGRTSTRFGKQLRDGPQRMSSAGTVYGFARRSYGIWLYEIPHVPKWEKGAPNFQGEVRTRSF